MGEVLEHTEPDGLTDVVVPAATGLKRSVLTPLETLAQAIAGIAPSATPGMLVPIVFGFAGNGTWLSYLLAMIGMLFTAQCINEFASRSACPGSLYSFVMQGVGGRLGRLTGWALLFAYVICTSACVTEFALYAISVANHFLHWRVTGPPLIVLAAFLVAYIAYRNIKLSATLMLWLELISVGLILLIVGLTLSKHGLSVDQQQLGLANVNFENVRMGLVMAIFSFAAFESAASLGSEAIEPLKSVPRAIMRSVIFSGIFFMVTSYAMVWSFRGLPTGLDKCSTPLLTMSTLVGIPALGHFIDAGIMMSFFAASLANLNAAARVMYKMSQDGFFHASLAGTHEQNCTPHKAVLASSSISLILAFALAALNLPLLDIVGWLGTIATFGFIFAYAATSISAAQLLRGLNQYSWLKMVVVTASICVLVFSLVGSLYPAPPFPYNLLPFIFAGYMAYGWFRYPKATSRATASQP